MKFSPVQILIVDDDEDDFLILKEYISNIVEQEFVIDWCYKYEEAEKRICEAKYHLYFVDYRLGAKTGLDLIQECIEKNCEEPFILLTGNGNRAIDMKAMESGAVDYLVKSELSTEKLERCIRYSLERASFLKVLRTNERKFRNIFERSKDTLFVADENLLFTEVNSASFALLGYDKSALLSKSLYSFFANKSDELVIRQELLETGDVSDKEIEILNRSSEKKQCVLTISREKDIAGNTYFQGIIHDVTTLKKVEKATLMVEKLNVAGRLVRIMAHEVRNPLSNIMLSVEQLDVLIHEPESKVCLEIISRNSKRIGDLITELLKSSKSEPVSAERTTLQSIIDESLEAATDRINLRHIQLQKNYPEVPAWVMADKEKLKIAFLNIIINAIESMQENKGMLRVTLEKEEKKYVVSIEDNGCGISEEDLFRVFEPYFTSKKNGMGLGLASTLNILQSHNATYDIHSGLNSGTVFKLFFHIALEVSLITETI